MSEMDWTHYARYKAKKCCGSGCEGCVYDPLNTKFLKNGEPNKNLQGWFVQELQKVTIDNSPTSDFHTLPDAEQTSIINLIKAGECPKEYWQLYFGKSIQ